MARSVGIVGLGAMGGPIARHLARAGIVTRVLDKDDEAVAKAVSEGASAATSTSDLGARSDVVIVVVPSDADVREVCLGTSGLAAAMHAGSVLVISASVLPATCEEVAVEAGHRDVGVLDAALTGGVRGAEAGRINLLVGGDEQVLAGIRDVLDPWTVAVHHLGGLGAGQVGKTVNNLCHWAQVAAVHEALRLGQLLGVAPSKARRALLDGPARSGTLAEIEQMRFTWWKKDIENAQRMAATIDHDLPLTRTVYDLMPGITVERIAAIVTDQDPDGTEPRQP